MGDVFTIWPHGSQSQNKFWGHLKSQKAAMQLTIQKRVTERCTRYRRGDPGQIQEENHSKQVLEANGCTTQVKNTLRKHACFTHFSHSTRTMQITPKFFSLSYVRLVSEKIKRKCTSRAVKEDQSQSVKSWTLIHSEFQRQHYHSITPTFMNNHSRSMVALAQHRYVHSALCVISYIKICTFLSSNLAYLV